MPSPPDRPRIPFSDTARRGNIGPPAHVPIRAHFRRFFDLRYRSVLRGMIVVFASTVLAFRISRFPHLTPNPWLTLPLLLAIAGTADTTRCMQKRWNWYHGGVVLCLYTDLMAICMIAFFLLYPLWL